MGMFYMKCVLYPCAAFWGVRNLYYEEYKSWWSWLISSLADFAYAFQFIEMWPQIFMNYKLKSVAHMPWRVLLYKFFHTIVDDFFAFFVMADHITAKHKWMSLRDDFIFVIYLAQLFIYREDRSRADEYGYVYADPRTGEKSGASKSDTGGESQGGAEGQKKIQEVQVDADSPTKASDSTSAPSVEGDPMEEDDIEELVAEGPDEEGPRRRNT